MRCPETALLVDVVYEEGGTEERDRVLAHLEECRECRERWSQLHAALAAADRWEVPSPPRGIAERAFARVATDWAREARSSAGDPPVVAFLHLLGFVLAGAAMAGLSLLFASVAREGAEHPLKLGLVGAVWTALYGGAGLLALYGRYRRLALTALIGSGLSVLVAPLLSMPAVIEICRSLEVAQASVVVDAALVLAGAMYAATPVFLVGATVVRARPRRVVADAVGLAVVYALLLCPSVYLQCQALELSLIASWVAGMLVGSWLGSVGAASIASRLRPLSA